MPPPPTSLPNPRAFLTNILNTFSTLQPSEPSNANSSIEPSLASAPAAAKPLLLTLHALFPHTLLPALDLLDRRLITRLVFAPSSSGQHAGASDHPEHATGSSSSSSSSLLRAGRGAAKKGHGGRIVYYVKSSSGRDGRSRYGSRGDVGATSYEVRTRGWGCSCAAFAFAAFKAPGEGVGYEDYEVYGESDGAVNEDEMLLDVEEGDGGVERVGDWEDWQWGGLMVEEDVPLCKHLLACVLAERWSVAAAMVEEREVGREEMAGWAAGWGG